ncbi:MAG TPA: ribulokinase [Fimbriimonadales bacterium]|nr:ribulokinase [Fimbriimonadales bacterium]
MQHSSNTTYSIGLDYGTNSTRAILVNTATGEEVATAVWDYPSGEAGILTDPRDPNLARQNPRDYIDGLYAVLTEIATSAKKAGIKPEQIVGIGVDTTASTPIPVDEQGIPLSFQERFKDNLAAQAWLWKDHTAHEEAASITERAKKMKRPFLAKCGGAYSSEWFWSKILHCKKVAPEVFDAAFSWIELCDFIPGILTGNTNPLHIARSVCGAGHKAMYSEEWGGLPDEEFLGSLDSSLAALRKRLYEKAYPSDKPAGTLCAEIAKRVGLPAGIPVAVGTIDAHAGGVGSGVKPGTLVKIIGTSSCDIAVSQGSLRDIPGISGIVFGSVIPDMVGLEAGQAAVGDIFNWFASNLCPEAATPSESHKKLSENAEKLRPGESGLLALDWNHGNRNVLADPLLSGLLIGMTLHTTSAEVYRALVESTAFGALTIIKRLEEYEVPIEEVVGCGGIAEKNPFVMQIYADVLNRPMKVSRSAQSSALGAAIFGAVVGGAHRNVPEAQQAMAGVKPFVYEPNPENAKIYAELYALYKKLHDAFGTPDYNECLYSVMKELIAIRNRTRKI